MEIRIDTEILSTNDLTISEYLYLKLIYEENDDKVVYQVIDRVDDDSLQARGYIRILEGQIILREKGLELFEGKDLFLKFMTMFPIKAPSGRFLSPLRSGTLSYKKLEKKWKSLFKGKPHLQQQALDVLEAELTWRRKSGSMEYIHNMETWLNQGDYDNYAYLLDEKKDENYKDFM